MRRINAAEVIVDFDLYPRDKVDTKHVLQIVDALVAGVELPTIITDKKSKRAVDGVHRLRACVRLDAVP